LAHGQEALEEGIYREHYKSGQLKHEMIPNNIEDGNAGGVNKGYYENGQLKYETIFQDRVRGIYKKYYENGELKSEVNFKGASS